MGEKPGIVDSDGMVSSCDCWYTRQTDDAGMSGGGGGDEYAYVYTPWMRLLLLVLLCVICSLVGIRKQRLSAVMTMPLQFNPSVIETSAALASTVSGG